ncbi:MAG TPA: GNAT family N-acetyltransferase [Tepidisphaeraceae bacterium]|jgi:predicted GNAT family N-acyltransferase
METPAEVRLVLGSWSQLRADALAVRMEVFVVEQGIPPEMEPDEHDQGALHAVAYDAQGTPLATGRLLPGGQIGRMATRAIARGRGVGGAILEALIARAKADGQTTVVLRAQRTAERFYAAHGFVAEGAPFLEANIPHIRMRRPV